MVLTATHSALTIARLKTKLIPSVITQTERAYRGVRLVTWDQCVINVSMELYLISPLSSGLSGEILV